VELGIPTAVLACGGLVAWLLRARPWRETDTTRQLAWGVLAVIGLHSLLEYPLWYGPFQMATGLCLWLLWSSREPNDQDVPDGKKSRFAATMPRIVTSLVILAGLSYAAWDYRRISQIYLPLEKRALAYRDNTLDKLRSSWLFRDQVRFAELTITPLTRENAAWTHRTASDLLHYSPEPRVIEKLIESAVLLNRDEEALAYLARYRAAFPAEHARWAKGLAKPLGPDLRHEADAPSAR
jgi:Virulence factor membrane-bound polymerase, C-terminal